MALFFLVCLLIFTILLFSLLYMTNMPGSSYSGPLQQISELEKSLADSLKAHVKILAGQIGVRNIWHYEQLEASSHYIEEIFTGIGLEVKRQQYTVNDKVVKNLEVEFPGYSTPEKIVVAGAHYDTVSWSQGANDNASGVAALFEIAKLLSGEKLANTVKLVAFVNEEPPFFKTRHMGSRVYASLARQRGDQIIGMISIECIGYYSEERKTQHYPFPLGFFYPKTANFIAFVGNISSRSLVHKSISAFRNHVSFPSEGISAIGFFPGIDLSDHWSFWKEDYPAIMITDTAFFRYNEYHTQRDTPEKIDYARMGRVVLGISCVIKELASIN